jgi:hypothetical protein
MRRISAKNGVIDDEKIDGTHHGHPNAVEVHAGDSWHYQTFGIESRQPLIPPVELPGICNTSSGSLTQRIPTNASRLRRFLVRQRRRSL